MTTKERVDHIRFHRVVASERLADRIWLMRGTRERLEERVRYFGWRLRVAREELGGWSGRHRRVLPIMSALLALLVVSGACAAILTGGSGGESTPSFQRANALTPEPAAQISSQVRERANAVERARERRAHEARVAAHRRAEHRRAVAHRRAAARRRAAAARRRAAHAKAAPAPVAPKAVTAKPKAAAPVHATPAPRSTPQVSHPAPAPVRVAPKPAPKPAPKGIHFDNES
jgi:cell division protein FtsN